MIEYDKIETLYNRDPSNPKRVTDEIRLPEFEIPQRWVVTEKIDGKNTRVIYQGGGDPRVQFRGRTDNAQMSANEYQWLYEKFPASKFENAFDLAGPGASLFTCTLYGEFYGPKIQSGGWYRDDYGFRIFDVKVGDWWLNWDDVLDVSNKLGVSVVPTLAGSATLEEALDLVKRVSITQTFEAAGGELRYHEGIVARTDPLLFMRDGRRLMWKLKVKDFN